MADSSNPTPPNRGRSRASDSTTAIQTDIVKICLKETRENRRVHVFISYQRADSRHATGRLCDYIATQIGRENVFYDVDSVSVGEDFRVTLGQRLSDIDVLLVMVGPNFDYTRLKRGNDYVRAEVLEAMSQGKLVVPVLVDGASIPEPTELPDELRELAFRQGAPLRPDPDFERDAHSILSAVTSAVLARTLDSAVAGSAVAPEVTSNGETGSGAHPSAIHSSSLWIAALLAVAVTSVAALITLVIIRTSGGTDANESVDDLGGNASVDDSATVDVDGTEPAATATDPPPTAPTPQSEAELATTVESRLIEVLPSSVRIEASSSLPPSGDGSTYEASNLLDNRLETAWNHCGSESECGITDDDPARNGIGELLVIHLPNQLDVVGLRIANGYQKTDPEDAWPENNRIASVDVYGTLGERQQVSLADSRDYQDLFFDRIATDVLTIEVREVYVGGKYRDLAVSEIRVLVRE